MSNNEYNYIVYCHESPSGKRYVGITRQLFWKRWNYGIGYRDNHHFNNAIKKYGWKNIEHYILFENLDEKTAKAKEIELIALWDLTNPKKGYNISKGGDNPAPMSEEGKKKVSEALQGNLHGLGKKRSEEVRKILSIHKMGANNPMYGKPSHRRRKVIQYDFDFNIIAIYDSMHEASQQTKVSVGNIGTCCHRKRNWAGGFIWRYADDDSMAIDEEKEFYKNKKLKQANKTA